MKCPNCENEIPEGTIYCEHCGQEIQIVPDYNMLEDDVLPQILEEKPKPEPESEAKSQEGQNDASSSKKTSKNKRSRNITMGRIAIFGIATCVMITIVIVVYSITDRYLHSFGYISEQAEIADDEKRYEAAVEYYRTLLEMEPDNTAIKFALGRDLYRIAEYEDAQKYLLEVIEDDPNSKDSFEMLLKIYDKDSNYESMEKLITKTENKEILEMIDEYLILPPVASSHGGEYDDDLTVELSSPEGYEIRYTIDDTDPAEEGEVYEEPLEITDGTTILRAVCIDKNGKVGFETREEYTVHYESPDMPDITPESGAYNVMIPIEIYTTAKNADIYYAWDDDNPTIYSNKYYGPIEMPVGNHILSVIVINSHGLSSDVLRSNYDYEPAGAAY